MDKSTDEDVTVAKGVGVGCEGWSVTLWNVATRRRCVYLRAGGHVVWLGSVRVWPASRLGAGS